MEDDVPIAEILQTNLELAGWDVDHVPGSAGAVVALAMHDYDLLVLDVMVPGPMDGIELAQKVRAVDPDSPIIIVITGKSLTQGEVQAVREVGAELMLKPSTAARFLEAAAAAGESP